jgi:CheY-specific phosphatase CheX
MHDDHQVLAARLRESCEELLRATGVAWVSEQRAPGAGRQVASVVGFQGAGVRGSMTIRSSPEFFRATRPAAPGKGAPVEAALVDWAGEVVNQLLGRFKNKVMAHGLDFQVGLPVTITGDNLTESAATPEAVIVCAFGVGGQVFQVTLVSRFVAGFKLDDSTGSIVVPAGLPLEF